MLQGLFLRGGPHYLCGKREGSSIASHGHGYGHGHGHEHGKEGSREVISDIDGSGHCIDWQQPRLSNCLHMYKHPPRCCNNEACTGDRLGGGRDFEGDKADKPESSIRCQDCMKRKNIERIAKLLYSDFYARWVDHGQVSRSEGWVDQVSGWVLWVGGYGTRDKMERWETMSKLKILLEAYENILK